MGCIVVAYSPSCAADTIIIVLKNPQNKFSRLLCVIVIIICVLMLLTNSFLEFLLVLIFFVNCPRKNCDILHLTNISCYTRTRNGASNGISNTSFCHPGPPSTPTVDSMEYSVGDSTTGRFRFLVSSSGRFRTEVAISAGVVGGSGTVEVTDNNITVTGLSYTGSHTVSVVATSDVCPGVLNSITVVPVVFNIACEWNTKVDIYLFIINTFSQPLY